MFFMNHSVSLYTHIHQPRKTSRQNACTHNTVQSLTASVSESQVADIIPL